MARNLRKFRRGKDRCLCGLRVPLHFTLSNVKLSCSDAALAHPHATVVAGQTLRAALIASIEKAVKRG